MLIKNYSDQEIEINEEKNIIRVLNHVYDDKGNRYRLVCIRYNYCDRNCVGCKLASNVLYLQNNEQERNDGQVYNYDIEPENYENRNTFL